MASLKDEIGDFVAIPHSFIEDDQQTAESRVVFMILRYHTNRRRKRSFPGYETIMRETGLSRQKTAEGIAVLAKTGWLVKHRQFGRATEYELRYPAGHDSSTGELSEGVTIVPPADHDSSTGERLSNSNNKIEFNEIDRARENQPPKPKTGEPLFAIEEVQNSDVFPGLENELAVYGLDFEYVYTQWWRKYFRLGGIGRRPGTRNTARQYAECIRSYFDTWSRREAVGNGNKRAEEPDYLPAYLHPPKQL